MKRSNVLFPVFIVIIGWFIGGFGFTTKLGHPISTICFYLGLGLIFLGFISFILRVKNK
ncbi:dolichyl-diphosphooligosaccharide--protein glycosyltransferase subunit 2 [Flavobacterium humidisoli]|uniref:Dolichyl-diphosphooligosaccharide--protein glycosyltransferase subunit 2 n=1 Tax=Flavobacterium humidisoli TaxID=2937442 RepID=A0ABY4LVQ1_9FLAO|nr:dolichyl-diphosphooligosaccharide--protein glycosyltransferase subunit 2 [Flavobacterium humidisoli]UPZ16922.1 dolichyl-diphosphooligosaccharide--protein glycosyltransferase subunit 2 [Flavobacterium humidisoli]